ncbi:MAG: hypothetical protein IPH00_10470 [Flavobacteriales bacterium]|nr:hypothetical protein [Flavobacteriales bacterium]
MTGAFVVIYTVGSGSCSTSDQATVTVVPATVVDPGPDQQLCIDEPAFSLGATPVGGTWTGNGISGDDFDPLTAGAGAHVLSYTWSPQGTTPPSAINLLCKRSQDIRLLAERGAVRASPRTGRSRPTVRICSCSLTVHRCQQLFRQRPDDRDGDHHHRSGNGGK